MLRKSTVLALLVAISLLTPWRGVAQDAIPASRAADVQPSADYAGDLTEILSRIVDADGLVRYDAIASNPTPFLRVLKAIEEYDAPLVTDEQKLAFWINAYNVQMIKNVLDHPDVANVVAGDMAPVFFNRPLRTAGHSLSLDEIEHVILRRDRPDHRLAHLAVKARDPRIHVGLNCAAVSCPALQASAFVAPTVDDQLDRAMRAFANGARHFRVEDGDVVVSSLLDWFSSDWDLYAPAGDYLVQFMAPSRPDYDALLAFLSGKDADAIRRGPRTRYEYDWTVNRAR